MNMYVYMCIYSERKKEKEKLSLKQVLYEYFPMLPIFLPNNI